jgi:hypothetical protein
MFPARRTLTLLALGAIVAAALLGGCSKFDPGDRNPNLPPETTLSFAPAIGDTANYEVRMNWFGWDTDGKIEYYQTAWDWPDSLVDPIEGVDWDAVSWRNVINTDSVFYVGASSDTVTVEKGFQGHRFAVRAVDDEGAADQTPENIEFTAFTFVPNTILERGPSVDAGAVTGTMVSFEWRGEDRDGVITGFKYRLSKWDGDWVPVVVSDTLTAEETEVNFGPIFGLHLFEVWAYDDAGAFDRTPATVEFTCNETYALGPELVIFSNLFERQVFKGPVMPITLPLPVFRGERMRFNWVADASDYGGEVIGYRHAYDDTTQWPAWSVFNRTFAVAPDGGEHTLFVQAIDNANAITRGSVPFEVVDASLDDYILIVDDYDLKEVQDPRYGDDAARTLFHYVITAPFERERVEWEPSQNIVENYPQPPDVASLARASTVIWYTDGTPFENDVESCTLWSAFHAGSVVYNPLAGYIRVGGNLILCGLKGVGAILEEASYTYHGEDQIEVTDADTTKAGIFVRDFLRVGYAANSGDIANQSTPYQFGYCFYGAQPTAQGEALGFEPVYIDSVGPGGWPEKGKWPLYTPMYGSAYFRSGVSQVEMIEPYMDQAVTIYNMDSHINFNFEGAPCGQVYLSGTNHSNVAYLGFPLYYLQTDHARGLIDRLLTLMGEEKSDIE